MNTTPTKDESVKAKFYLAFFLAASAAAAWLVYQLLTIFFSGELPEEPDFLKMVPAALICFMLARFFYNRFRKSLEFAQNPELLSKISQLIWNSILFFLIVSSAKVRIFKHNLHSSDQWKVPNYTIHYAKIMNPTLLEANGICSFVAFRGEELLNKHFEATSLGRCAGEFEAKVQFFCGKATKHDQARELASSVQANFGKKQSFDLKPNRSISIVATANCLRSDSD